MIFFAAIGCLYWKVISPLTKGCASVLQSTANAVDRVGDSCHVALESIAGSVDKLSNGILSSSAAFTRTLNISVALLTNAVLGICAMVVLAPLLHLSQFSSTLRFIVWMMYFVLCLSMVAAYIRQQYFPTGKTHF